MSNNEDKSINIDILDPVLFNCTKQFYYGRDDEKWREEGKRTLFIYRGKINRRIKTNETEYQMILV